MRNRHHDYDVGDRLSERSSDHLHIGNVGRSWVDDG
jgi:hypothetical protein